MEKQIWKIFPTLVHRVRQVLSPMQLALIKDYCQQVDGHKHESLLGDAVSTFEKNSRFIEDLEAKFENLKGLKMGLSTLLEAYAIELGYKGAAISNSWFNIQRPGSILKHHTHPDSLVSAALCVYSDDQSTSLHFENPNPLLAFLATEGRSEYNMEMAKFKLEPGDMVLFPSWLKHGSGFEANESPLRIVISLNTV
ncbi:MAG: Synechococcus phage [Pseudomonadota bacterium]